MKVTNLFSFKVVLSFAVYLLSFYNLEAQTIISVEGQILIPDHPIYHDDREVENEHDHLSETDFPAEYLYAQKWATRKDHSFSGYNGL